MSRSIKPWGNRSEATKAQRDRMARLHQAIRPFTKSVSGYKRLRRLLPEYIPVRIGATLKGCAVSVSTLTDEKPAVVEKLIRTLLAASRPERAGKKSSRASSSARKVKPTPRSPAMASLSTRRLAEKMTLEEIGKAAPYTLKQRKNGDWAIMLGALQYMRFEGAGWAQYYCDALNQGYREMLRELKSGAGR